MTTKPSTHRFIALDGLRGVAAIAVVLFHFAGSGRPQLTPRGYLAVDFFFILSGFVLDHAYRRELEGRTLSPGAFAWRRWFRLWPVAAIGIVLGALEQSTRGMWSAELWPALGCGLLLLPVFTSNAFLYPLNPPQWSLFHELLVNVAYAVAAPRLTRRVLAIGLPCAGALLVATTLHSGIGEHFGPARVVYGFFAGVALHRVAAEKPTRGPWALTISGIVLAGCFVLPRAVLLAPTDALFALAIFPGVVWTAAHVELNGFGARIGGLLGAISYPLYAIHFPLIRFLTRRPLSTFGSIVATVGLCLASYAVGRWIDEPARRWISRHRGLARSEREELPLVLPTASIGASRRNRRRSRGDWIR